MKPAPSAFDSAAAAWVKANKAAWGKASAAFDLMNPASALAAAA